MPTHNQTNCCRLEESVHIIHAHTDTQTLWHIHVFNDRVVEQCTRMMITEWTYKNLMMIYMYVQYLFDISTEGSIDSLLVSTVARLRERGK